MITYYRRKVFLLLMVLLLFFAGLCITVLVNPHLLLFNIGLSPLIQNRIIALFSFASICLILWDLQKL